MKGGIPAKVRREVKARADGFCEVCGMSGPEHMHHRKLQSQGGRHEAVNLLYIHFTCHDSIHLNRARSEALGHIVPGWADPADVPVQALIPGRTP